MSRAEDLTDVKAKRIVLRDHPNFDETWVRNGIESEPKILHLGNLILRDKERTQPDADPETKRRNQEVVSCLFTR